MVPSRLVAMAICIISSPAKGWVLSKQSGSVRAIPVPGSILDDDATVRGLADFDGALWTEPTEIHSFATASTVLSINDDAPMIDLPGVSPLLVVAFAVVLGVAAQSFINQMLKGDQGLGAFLRDGSGYNRSGFVPRSGSSPRSSNDDANVDPLPWLRLPKLDFVEVAGQQSAQDQLIMERLEGWRAEMNELLERGDIEGASVVRAKLETTMKENGIEYRSD